MIAYCGLNCSTCPIHLATIEPDRGRQQAMREDIARQCTEVYGMNIDPKDVNDCDGCLSPTGRLFSGCAQCEIRKCAIGRKLLTCAFCPEYPCELLRKHFALDPSAQSRLDAIRYPS